MEAARAPGPGGLELNEPVVRAAGGIVSRPTARGREVLLVHRPKYDDWTLPKGKTEGDESDEACALREVEEETGLICAIDGMLGETRYVDGKDRPKVVRWYAMHPLEGVFVPHEEIDEIRWLSIGVATATLTYERDRALLEAFADEHEVHG